MCTFHYTHQSWMSEKCKTCCRIYLRAKCVSCWGKTNHYWKTRDVDKLQWMCECETEQLVWFQVALHECTEQTVSMNVPSISYMERIELTEFARAGDDSENPPFHKKKQKTQVMMKHLGSKLIHPHMVQPENSADWPKRCYWWMLADINLVVSNRSWITVNNILAELDLVVQSEKGQPNRQTIQLYAVHCKYTAAYTCSIQFSFWVASRVTNEQYREKEQ